MPTITIRYRGENGPGWVPASQRALWAYAVRTGQVVLPEPDDGGPSALVLDPGDDVELTWIPPEFAGRLREVPAPPQPTHFALTDDEIEETSDGE